MTLPVEIGRGFSELARGGTCAVCNAILGAIVVMAYEDTPQGRMGFPAHPVCWDKRPEGWSCVEAMKARQRKAATRKGDSA